MPRKKLTDEEWALVFRLRCRSKEGRELSRADHALIGRAYTEDPDRYGAMGADVFDATVPFGSNVKAPR